MSRFARTASGRFDVVCAERVAADAPLIAGDLFDQAPREPTHALAGDLGHCVGQALDHLSLLWGRKDALDHLDLDQRHAALSLRPVGMATIFRPHGASHIGQTP